jgi:hypothetical protein
MNTPFRISFVCVLLVAAALSGFWLGRVRHSNDGSAPNVASSVDAARAVAQLQTENQRLRTENALLNKTKADLAAGTKAPPSSSGPSALQQLNILAEAQKAKTVSIRMSVIGRDGNLADGFVKLFGLSDLEQQTLKGALDQARRQIDQLSSSNTTVKQEGNALVVAISPFDGGGDVYDNLMDAFAQTLGPERNAAFVALQTDQFTSVFNSFGAEQHTMTLSLQANGYDDPKIAVRDQHKGPNNNFVNVTQVSNTAELAQRYPQLAPYVDKVSSLPIQSIPKGPPLPVTIRP